MNIYIYDRLYGMTENWHSEAGAAVIAGNEQQARQLLLEAHRKFGLDESDLDGTRPSVYPLSEAYDGNDACIAHVFPDVGCCK